MITLNDMRSCARLFKIKLNSALDYRLLMLDIEVEYLGKIKYLRLVIYEREHIYSTGILKLRVLVELVEEYLRIYVSAVLLT